MSFERAYVACRNCYQLEGHCIKTLTLANKIGILKARNESRYEAMRALESVIDLGETSNEALEKCRTCNYANPLVAKLLDKSEVFIPQV
jgi:hypothetical protein